MTYEYDKFIELERLKQVQEKSQICGDFLEWLQIKYIICESNEYPSESSQIYTPAQINIQNILAEYFDINLDEVEKEKLKLLQSFLTKEETL